MHTRLDDLYNCNCDDCKAQQRPLNLSIQDKFKQLLNVGSKAFKHLHKKGTYSPEDLKTEKPYQNLIKSTFDIFNFAIQDNDMPEDMQRALQSDAFLFGGLKANAQLFEASKMLLNTDGRLKPFSEVNKVFDKLNVNYNQNYIEAEYEFAVASSQMAAKWSELGNSDRYNLQYRTAQDERVRKTHADLANTTLPKEDPFWSSYYPPNGWRCRCTAIEVLKDKYPVDNSDEAIKNGEAATTEIGKNGKNRLEIFRFNPGQNKVVFPPGHPYGKVKGANIVLTMFSTPTPEEMKALRKEKDKEIKEWAKENIPESGKVVKSKNFITGELHISRGSIKSIGDHFTEVSLKEVSKHIISNLKNCKYIQSAPLNTESSNYQKKLKQGVTQFHYYEFEWDNKKFRLNTEEINGKFEKPYAANLIIKK